MKKECLEFSVRIGFLVILLALVYSCEKESPSGGDSTPLEGNGFFIVNEGNFNSGNSSLSFYSYDSSEVYNDIYYLVNNRPLGDIANSALATDDYLYIVVNNSGKVEVTDINTLESIATIDGLASPRFMGIVNNTRAYVSSLFSDSVAIVNLESYEVTGYINLSMSSEHISVSGNRAFITNWAGESSITVIDTGNDAIIRVIDLAPEPGRVVFDSNGHAWVLCNGGYLNEEYPALYRFDPETGEILSTYLFETKEESPGELCIDGSGLNLYFINSDLYRMSVNDQFLPVEPFIESGSRNFYRLDFDRENDILLVTDAMDFMQRGYVYGYDPSGEELFNFRAGMIPGSICFKPGIDIK